MSTSGTTSFVLDLGEIYEEACDRAGVEGRTGYDLRSFRRSLNLMTLEWNSAGLNLWTIDSQTLNIVAGTATYTLPSDTIDVLDAVIRTNAGNTSLQSDLVIERISFDTYNAIPNKQTQGRPIEFYVWRGQAAPTVTFWQTPDASQPYQFVYYRMRQIQDSGTVANTEDIPVRFLPALTAGLAFHIAVKKSNDPQRIEMLKDMYDEAFRNAADEDRERATFRWLPRIDY